MPKVDQQFKEVEARNEKDRRAVALRKLDFLQAGEKEENWRDINAVGDSVSHWGIAKVVIRLEDDEKDYAPGVELVRRICAIPKMVDTLKAIANCSDTELNVYDMVAAAREVLGTMGIDYD